MAYSERRQLPERKPPQETFYTQQRRQEYKTFAQEYVKPTVEQAVIYSPEEYEKAVVEPVRETFEEQLKTEEQKALDEGVPKATIEQWKGEQRQEFEKYLKTEVYPRRLPSAGEQWIRKPTLEMLSDVFYGMARQQREWAKQPWAKTAPQLFRYPAALEVLGGIVEAAESTLQIVFPAPAPPPERPVTPARVTGYVVGVFLTGKVAAYVMEPAISTVKLYAAERLTKSYEEAARASELWKPSIAQKVLMKVTGAKPQELPSAIVGFPQMVEKEALGMGNVSKFIIGMEAFEWTEAPKTIGFGLTKAAVEETAKKGITEGLKTVAKEALPYTVYFAGRQVSLAEPTGILGFEKTPYHFGEAGKLHFAKQKLPSLSDLLKETKAETTLTKVLLEPSETILPALTGIPEAALEGLPRLSAEIFATSILGLTLIQREVQKPKRETKAMSLAAEIIKPIVSPAAAAKAKVKQAPLVKEIAVAIQVLRAAQVPEMLKPSKQVTRLSRKREEELFRRKTSAIFGKKPKLKMGIWIYPVATESEASRYVLEGLPKQKKRKR